MAKVEKSVLVKHSAAQMYDLVDAVEQYPAFLPWCGGSKVIQRTAETTEARIDIDYHGIKQHFSTRNAKIYPSTMTISLVEGPFRTFHGQWSFIPLNDSACKILFSLEYEFSSRIFERIIAPVFHHIANTFVDSFVVRANDIYRQKENR